MTDETVSPVPSEPPVLTDVVPEPATDAQAVAIQKAAENVQAAALEKAKADLEAMQAAFEKRIADAAKLSDVVGAAAIQNGMSEDEIAKRIDAVLVSRGQ